MSQLTARPDYLRLFPRGVQNWVGRRAIRPAGSGWLIDRVKSIPITTGVFVKSVAPIAGQVRVTMSDGSERVADHLLFATGYRIDIAKYPFLDPLLLNDIDRVNGYPRLKPGLESSVPGLYFSGAGRLELWSRGPICVWNLLLCPSPYSKDRVRKLTMQPKAILQPPVENVNEPPPSTRLNGVGGVVIGGDYQGLGIVRSLGRRGIPVCIIDDEHSISRYSRYATHFVRVKNFAR